jgi:hypothetical protein
MMFDDADPLLARVRSLALAFPSAAEKISHGRPNFFTKKVFAVYGGSHKGGTGKSSEWTHYAQSLVLLIDEAERTAILQDDRFFVPAYYGPYGWIGLRLTKQTDWTEVGELLDASYRLTAPAKLVAQLDATS